MELHVDDELREIARQIGEANRSFEEWRAIESDDMIQTKNYVGGFDATEDAFCFSFHSPADGEQWFQFTLQEAKEIANGRVNSVAARTAE